MSKPAFKEITLLIREVSVTNFSDSMDNLLTDKLFSKSRMARQLQLLRMAEGISQSEVAALMKCSGGKVAKLELCDDTELRYADVCSYFDSLDYEMQLVVRKKIRQEC